MGEKGYKERDRMWGEGGAMGTGEYSTRTRRVIKQDSEKEIK